MVVVVVPILRHCPYSTVALGCNLAIHFYVLFMNIYELQYFDLV